MITIIAERFVKEEHLEQFLENAALLVEASRQEEGNLSYDLLEDLEDPCHLTYVERWEDEKAIAYHNASPHFTHFVPLLATFCAKKGPVTMYKEVFPLEME